MGLPYIKFYPGDYMRDTHHLTTEQHGLYFLLLMRQWSLGYLPDDERQLAAISHVNDLRHWRKISPAVLCFFHREGGKLVQPRMAKDWEHAERCRANLSRNGAKGVLAKALKNKERGQANANQMDKPSGVGVNTTESVIHSEEEKKESFNAAGARFEEFMAAYPRKEGRKAAYAAFFNATLTYPAQDLIDGARRYAIATIGDHPRYMVMPGKWIDDERWKDEFVQREKPVVQTPAEAAGAKLRQKLGFTKREKEDDEGATIIDLTINRN